MDKSWIQIPRNTVEYCTSLEKFLEFATLHSDNCKDIVCHCSKCECNKFLTKDKVYEHLLRRPFPRDYTTWVFHGESYVGETSTPATNTTSSIPFTVPTSVENQLDTMEDMVHDAFGVVRNEENPRGQDVDVEARDDDETSSEEFFRILNAGQEPLYDGSTFSQLSFLMRLYHIKYMYRISDKAMSMILELLREAFSFAKLLLLGYEAKKTIKSLGMKYTKIDACPKDCMLYWGSALNEESCKVCHTSGYKKPKRGDAVCQGKKKVAAKVFRYFPLILRLQRLFMSSKSAEQMIWHSTEKPVDDMLRHPRDSEAWKNFDQTYPEFASEPRNVRLGLASDGFNPFGMMSSNHSTWPVYLIPYNTPPWMCMKQTSLLLSSIIPGKKQPGNDIDIYLGPLVDELNTLWKGVETYDAFKKEWFTMKAILMWTISDFPGLELLPGWNTHSGFACPSCNVDAIPLRLPKNLKWCFIGSRRFLPPGHRFRLLKNQFDGNTDKRGPPKLLSGQELLEQMVGLDITFGKGLDPLTGKKRPREDQGQWKKRSIFWDLPYWKSNLLRHNLDVMHIEKNVCDNILFTLLNDKDRRKDHLKARMDLVVMRIRKDLWPTSDGKCPAAIFTLSKQEIDIMLQTIKAVTVPDGYSSNISRCVVLTQRKMMGLKSHDSHILLHELLPISIRNVLPKQVASMLVEFSSCMKGLSAMIVNKQELDTLQERLVLAVCHMEMIFPPSFFTVMVHLVLHLVEEVRLGGPVQYRWMYPIERFLGKLKGFVGNRAHPEGSIAECWILDELFTFNSLYLKETVETRLIVTIELMIPLEILMKIQVCSPPIVGVQLVA
ncbi:hypothetical protein LINGRAHAP2_LOCUS30504 [Linum grandiflorum]